MQQTKITFLLAFLFLSVFSFAQEEKKGLLKLENVKINPVIGLQLWSTYTQNAQLFSPISGQYEAVDDRLNLELHRSRLGVTGQVYENIKFNIITAFDFVGKDALSATQGALNNGASPRLRLWNAFVQWRLIPQKEHLNVVVGYMPAQIGRESITAAFRVPSMEKAWSQNYMRRHIVGVGPGRVIGVNVGGLFTKEEQVVSFGYDVGIFTPQFTGLNGNTSGVQTSVLGVARLAFYIGDPESKTYTIGHKVNYFGKRKGLTVAVAASRQGTTDLFYSNTALGFDFLLNIDGFHLDGDWTFMTREGLPIIASAPFEVASNTGYVRAAYNINLSNGYVLEPSAMLVQFNGETEGNQQERAAIVGSLMGTDQSIEFGMNLYFNPNIKLSLHYTINDGELGAVQNGSSINNYYFQTNGMAIQRGDWLGLGLVTIF